MQQFLTDVYFGDLDVLLLDLPPGTGDVAISLGQLLPQAEVLVVTTPQPAAAEVAERSGLVARQTGQTVIGVVENMAGLAARGSVLELFGSGGGADLAARLSTPELPVPVLATIPLSVAAARRGATPAHPSCCRIRTIPPPPPSSDSPRPSRAARGASPGDNCPCRSAADRSEAR